MQIYLLLLFLTTTTTIILTNAISFDLAALGDGNTVNKRCFSLYIGKDVMTTGSYSTSPSPGSSLNFEITDSQGNVFNTRKNAKENEKFSFTSHAYSDYVFCFNNVLNPGVYPNPEYTRSISFNVNIGAEARDNEEIATKEHLKPVEVELRVLEQVLQGIVDEMEYLKEREAKLRDTNESTNDRVKMFSLFSIGALVASGVWQVYYLRSFFQSKKIL